MIGNVYPIIPLFEFLYLLYENKSEEEINNNEKLGIKILNDLLDLIQILKKSKKNILYIKETNFYKIISFFLEKLPNNIIDKSNYLQFLFDSTQKENIKEIEDDNNFYKYLFLNFKLVEKYNQKKREEFFSYFSLGNLFDKIKENLTFSEIIIYIKDYEEISPKIKEFLRQMYFGLKDKKELNDKNGMTYLYKLFCEKYHQEIIDLTFILTNIEMNDPKYNFIEIFNEHFIDNILSFFIKEKNINTLKEMYKLIILFTERYYSELYKIDDKEKIQLTDFLIYYYRINEFMEESIQNSKDKFKVRPNKKIDIFFIECLNIIYRYIFIELVNIENIGKISLIDPYKEYDDNFIFGVIDTLFKYNFSDNYANNILFTHKFIEQFQKLIYYQLVLLDNCENKELKIKLCDLQEYTLRKFKLNYLKYLMEKNPIKMIKKLLFESFFFLLKEEKNNIIKINYLIDYINLFLMQFKIELFTYVPKIFDSKKAYIKTEDIHGVYNQIMFQINEFINEYNNNQNTQLKIDYNEDSFSFLESYILACIFSKSGDLVLMNNKEAMYKSVNKLNIIFDYKTLEFLCNYFICNFNNVKVEDYRLIILVFLIPICSHNIKKFTFKHSSFNQIKVQFRKLFIYLLQLIYIKIYCEQNSKFEQIFTQLDVLIKKIHKCFNQSTNPFLNQSAFFYII